MSVDKGAKIFRTKFVRVQDLLQLASVLGAVAKAWGLGNAPRAGSRLALSQRL